MEITSNLICNDENVEGKTDVLCIRKRHRDYPKPLELPPPCKKSCSDT